MSVQRAYDRAKAENRAALVGYLPAGFPSYEGAVKAAKAMVEGGCDVILREKWRVAWRTKRTM